MNKKIAIALHGGAGTILRSSMTVDLQKKYEQGLQQALDAGYAVLEESGSALNAVETAVMALEDFPLFNAGRGSVFNHEGKIEMDASIMSGSDLKAGAVCGVHTIKNPIRLARCVMERSEHVLLCGEGAEQFAMQEGIVFEKEDYFHTMLRYEQWQEALKENKI